ncbi:hypothetical protein KMZ68_01615 [Bradyrhizobium sediminis]|uniref:Uncharacterized protein n=1 Tax=Bradyrhizobium sediminis TaxID=2840469 RepID=A0A975NPI5_9BRAD|nr:hypothetical protein [Bradyrhizobium sediminis]QWG18625.1 hypothetical protein KMZ68_01615 [Bradyrhizobium sediminis]
MFISPSLVFVAGLVVIVLVAGALVARIRQLDAIERSIEHLEDKAQRTRLRLDVLSIRSNVHALVLISAVAFLPALFEVRKSLTSENTEGRLTSRELAPSIDRELQKQQHQQIIDAIRSLRPDTPSQFERQTQAKLAELEEQLKQRRPDMPGEVAVTNSSVMSSLVSLITGFGFVVLVACTVAILAFLYLLWSNESIRTPAYAVASAAVVGGSVWSGATLLKDVSLIKKVDSLIKFEYRPELKSGPTSEPQSTDIKLDLNLQLANLPFVKMACGDDYAGSGRISPFEDGTSRLVGEPFAKLNRMANSLAADVVAGRIIAIVLTGSADRRPLKAATATEFNSNQGLAEARVAVVRKQIEKELDELAEKRREKIRAPSIIESYAGPTTTHANLPITRLSADRAVQVCVLLNSEKPATPSALPTSPANDPPPPR